MSRFRRRAAVAVAAAAAVAGAAFALRFRSGARPWGRSPAASNVILVTLDTLRTDRLSCYGGKTVATPNIDAFAAEGVRFTNAASAAPLTLPAHASILTGLYPPAHGVRENIGTVLDARLPTLAELLGKAGWATGGFVSAFVLDRRWGIGRGFDRYFDDFDLGGMEAANAANVGLVRRDGAETVAAALSWLDARPAGRPFFLWLHLYDPHDPYAPKEPFRSRHPGRPYDGTVAYTDSLVGDFRRGLEKRGLLDGSLVVLTSDHGEGLGDHGETFHGFLVYETTIHAALIVRPPAGVRAGRVVDRAVSHVDLLPTILDLVGLKAPENVHGRSLAPLIAGEDMPWDRPVYSESLYPLLHYGWAPLRALRADRFKLIDAPRPELYDLARDPAEARNLHAAEANRARELTADLGRLRHRIESGKPSGGKAPGMDERAVARLRSLGYLAGGSGVGVERERERERADPKDRLEVHQKVVDAQSRISHREYDVAKRLLEQVLAEDEAIVDAHEMLGRIAAEQHRPEAAIRHYKRVLELKGPDALATLALADFYVGLGRFDDAAKALEEASRSGESAAFFANKLGEVRAVQGRDGDAAALFERAISLDGGFALPHFNLGVLHEKHGEVRPAIERYERALQLEPGFGRAQFNLGRLCAATGDVGRARQLWEASVQSNPGFVQGRYYLAKLLMDTGGDLVRAEKLAREGIALDPEHREGPLGWYVLADLLNRKGRAAEAREAAATGRRIEAAGKR